MIWLVKRFEKNEVHKDKMSYKQAISVVVPHLLHVLEKATGERNIFTSQSFTHSSFKTGLYINDLGFG